MSFFTVGSTLKRMVQEFRALRCDEEGVLHIMTPLGYSCDVFVQDQTSNLINRYFHSTDEIPLILSTQSVGSYVIDASPTTNTVAGDAITIQENAHCFQSIVKSKTANTITIVSPLDYAFTTSAYCKTGSWNLNVNGSISPISFDAIPIPGASIDVYTISVNMIDTSPMDSSLFGSIASLANGMVIRHEQPSTSSYLNIALLSNNSGFSEQGFESTYDPKPPSGTYGVRHLLNIRNSYGVARRIRNTVNEKLSIIVQDDLSGIDMVVATFGGHIVVP